MDGWMDGWMDITRIYSLCKKVTGGGASGATVGTGGSVNPSGMVSILHATRVHARHFVDMGAGDGRVLAVAAALGARSALGYELPDNPGYMRVYAALVKLIKAKMPGTVTGDAESLVAQDIDKVAGAGCTSCVVVR